MNKGIGKPFAVEPERLDTFDPLPDAGRFDGRCRKRCGEFDDEDTGAGRRDRPAPLYRAVGHQADRAEQGGGVSVQGHRPMVQVGDPRYGADDMSPPRPS